ncbi:unannotated protein [freshwater metagenome]|uniref:Unannotated protein n=1 Tax=freshwater metagenome TaxID=449393 RepID=A0A6J6NA45_9ZZZZ
MRHAGSPSKPYPFNRPVICLTDFGVMGALEKPQFPTISVVTPCRTVLWASGFTCIVKSEWLCGSTNPGETIKPVASISRLAADTRPISTIWSFKIPTSA